MNLHERGRRHPFLTEVEALRLRVAAAAAERGAKVIAVVGSGPKVGTTTLAIQLARAAVAEGGPLLLADAHRAAPSLHRAFGVSPRPGLLDLLHSVSPTADAIRSVDSHLALLPIGDVAQASATVERWQALFASLRSDTRLVVVDAGALGDPGTLTVAAAADAALLVIESGRSRFESVADAVQRLARARVAVLGVVINKRRFRIPAFLYRSL
jgi:Mrp family chromosome partitioning ATPase